MTAQEPGAAYVVPRPDQWGNIRWRLAAVARHAAAHAVALQPGSDWRELHTLCTNWRPSVRGYLVTWSDVLGLPAFVCTNCARRVFGFKRWTGARP